MCAVRVNQLNKDHGKNKVPTIRIVMAITYMSPTHGGFRFRSPALFQPWLDTSSRPSISLSAQSQTRNAAIRSRQKDKTRKWNDTTAESLFKNKTREKQNSKFCGKTEEQAHLDIKEASECAEGLLSALLKHMLKGN